MDTGNKSEVWGGSRLWRIYVEGKKKEGMMERTQLASHPYFT